MNMGLCQIVSITGHFDWDLLSVLLWSNNFITLLRCGPWPLARAWAVRLKSDEEVAGSTSNLTPSSSSTKPECGFGQFVIYDLTAWKPLGILIQAGLSLSYWSQLSNKQLAHSSSSSSSRTIAMHWVEGLSKSFEATLVSHIEASCQINIWPVHYDPCHLEDHTSTIIVRRTWTWIGYLVTSKSYWWLFLSRRNSGKGERKS